MRKVNKLPNKYRIRTGKYGSDEKEDGRNGAFIIPIGNIHFNVICSDGAGWEHVSVSLPYRCPTWGEMCVIKNYFFNEDETVVQYHPAKKDYVNQHPYCLHLWRPVGQNIPKPPAILVGYKNAGL